MYLQVRGRETAKVRNEENRVVNVKLRIIGSILLTLVLPASIANAEKLPLLTIIQILLEDVQQVEVEPVTATCAFIENGVIVIRSCDPNEYKAKLKLDSE